MNCIDFNNEQSSKIYNEYLELLTPLYGVNASKIARNVMVKNNGHLITKDPNGETSIIFNKMLKSMNKKAAINARVNMYSDEFLGKIGDWINQGINLDIRSVVTESNKFVINDEIGLYENEPLNDVNLLESELNEDNKKLIDCLGFAENGLAGGIKSGGMWKLSKVIQGPSHEQGGVDITLNNGRIKYDNKEFVAEEGLVIGQASDLGFISSDIEENNIHNYSEMFVNNNDAFENTIKTFELAIKNKEITQAKNADVEIKEEEPRFDFEVVESTGNIDFCNTDNCAKWAQSELYKAHNTEYNFEEWQNEYGVSGDINEMKTSIINAGGSKVDYENFEKGDIVEIHQGSNTEEGSTVGIIDNINDDGTYTIMYHSPGEVEGSGVVKRSIIDAETFKLVDDNNDLQVGSGYRIKAKDGLVVANNNVNVANPDDTPKSTKKSDDKPSRKRVVVFAEREGNKYEPDIEKIILSDEFKNSYPEVAADFALSLEAQKSYDEINDSLKSKYDTKLNDYRKEYFEYKKNNPGKNPLEHFNEKYSDNKEIVLYLNALDELERTDVQFNEDHINEIDRISSLEKYKTIEFQTEFVKEAEKVKKFYENKGIDVEIYPFYDGDEFDETLDAEGVNNILSTLNPEDDIVIMGHNGTRIGGIRNEKIAKMIDNSKAENCYLGTCRGGNIINYYKNIKSEKNIYYKDRDSWLGVNPYAEDFVNAMYGHKSPYNTVTDAEIIPAKIGETHDVYNTKTKMRQSQVPQVKPPLAPSPKKKSFFDVFQEPEDVNETPSFPNPFINN